MSLARSRPLRQQSQQQQHLAHRQIMEHLQVLVRTLSGRTVSLQYAPSGHLLDCPISEKVGVPVGSFYIPCNGMDLQRGIVLQMVGRLLGGTRPALLHVPGQWTCTACGMEGCWPSKPGCFRCLAPKPEGNAADASRPFGKGRQRERAYPGQPANHAPVNPSYRPPRPAPVLPGSVAQKVATVDLGDSATIAQVITLLSSLGVSGVLLKQVRSSIPPPSVNKSKSVGPE